MPTGTRVVIVGAGLAGALLACMLGRRGYRVQVYERRPDPRQGGYVGGRSINLALSTRGITALRAVGLADRVLKDAVPMRGRLMHLPDGRTTFQRYSATGQHVINSVSRNGLNRTLVEAADELPDVSLHFRCRCTGVDLDRRCVLFQDAQGEPFEAQADAVFGADGAYSAVRLALQTHESFTYHQEYLEYGYKELTIPPVQAGPRAPFALEPNALHIWPRGSSMMIALPNADGSFTCTLFWPYEGRHGFSAIDPGDPAGVVRFFSTHYADAVPLMPTLADDYRRNPVGSLVTIRCWPWQRDGWVCLIGDAAHAVVPFYGQGMNAAFEDCRVLCEMLDSAPADFASVFARFQSDRKPHADAIADMALENFVEMRDRVASPVFRAHKRIEQGLARALPGVWVPRYDLVSFSNTPYAVARERAQRQWGWVWLIASGLPVGAVAVASVLWDVRVPLWVLAIALWGLIAWVKGPRARTRRPGPQGAGPGGARSAASAPRNPNTPGGAPVRRWT